MFSLAGWPPLLPTGFLVPRGTPAPAGAAPGFAYGAFTLSGRPSQRRSARLPPRLPAGPHPGALRAPVWAPPVPLAATPGITFVFSSSGYLDVSVRRLAPRALWIRARVRRVLPARVPPFRHPRISGHLPLPAAFRSLSRLSSACSAKASALRPFQLSHRGAPSVARRSAFLLLSSFLSLLLLGLRRFVSAS